MGRAVPELDAAVAPLRYAARGDYRNLEVVRGLETAVRAGLERAELSPPRRKAFFDLLEGLDAAPLVDKRRRIEALLALAARAEPDGEPRPAEDAAPDAPPVPVRPAAPTPKRRPTGRALRAAAPTVEADQGAPKRMPMTTAEPGTPLDRIIGVGPKTADKLAKRGFNTVQDLLFFLPRDYEDRSSNRVIAELQVGERATVEGEVLGSAVRYAGRGRRIFEAVLSDGTGRLTLRFFRFRKSQVEGTYERGARLRVTGSVTRFGGAKQMVHPETHAAATSEAFGGWTPVYSDIEGVPPRTLRSVVQKLAAACAHRIVDPMPRSILERYGHPELAEAVRAAHCPGDRDRRELLERMRARLVFDELLYLQLALATIMTRREQRPGIVQSGARDFESLGRDLFPFVFTRAQSAAMTEIASDLESPRPMNRLLQGDVGSGKTAVAMLAAALVQRAGRQTAILAPTEILAEQHAGQAQRILQPHGLRTALLTGSTSAKARTQLVRWLERGEVDVVIGTHALLEPDVAFRDLGLVVIDEQHRFGVQQRKLLSNKRSGEPPDVLVMTATPIPRTLAMTAYGDLRVSVIDELPPGRSPTVTRVFDSGRSEPAYRAVREEIARSRQAYVVFPLVEQSEKLDLKAATDAVDELTRVFAPFAVGLLHGRMRPDEKSEVMKRFIANEVQVLVSTTVVEVGVDVPNATCIIIEDAERFGLSQLHQLRGRVGRGQHAGRCFLITEKDGVERLRVLEETSSGFEVADRDLQLRGPGEFLGTRQSGLSDLAVADLVRDAEVLEQARAEAQALLVRDPTLSQVPTLRAELQRRFAERLSLASVG